MTKHYTVVFTPDAEKQLDSLYVYIADHSGETRADDFVGGVVEECISLSRFPERGTKRNDVRPNLRTLGYARRVTIAFSVNSATNIVTIHGVFYGGRDFEQLLRDDD
jgi:toxin ParE1/3/4